MRGLSRISLIIAGSLTWRDRSLLRFGSPTIDHPPAMRRNPTDLVHHPMISKGSPQ